MMRSMFSGISGLKGFQSSMDVIGNNIANVNTVGFKVSRTTFQSMLNQTVVGAKSPESGGRGGTNAMQIGLGSQIGSIGKVMTQGSFQNTGKKTDLGLQGDGFFVLSDGLQSFYTRSGNYELDSNGNFIQPSTGLKLQGWISKVDPKTGQRYLDLDKPPSDLFIQAGMTMGAKATSNMDLGGNLNADVGIEPLTITVKNPDDPTKTYKVRFTFEKKAPFDTKRVFSGSTIKYTWNAEIVDWNAENPSELPELTTTTGMVELNQFGQIEKFYEYPTTMLEGKSGSLKFDDTIVSGDSETSSFNYSPTGATGTIGAAVKDIFDANDDNILDKVITKAVYNLSNLGSASSTYDYSVKESGGTTALSASTTAKMMTVNIGENSTGDGTGIGWKPASGDVVNVSYYTQEDQIYISTKTKYNLSGPILNSEGADEITEVDVLVSGVDSAGATSYLLPNTDFTYDANTGTVNILNKGKLGTDPKKVRMEYCTKDSFVANGTKNSWDLTKKAIVRPAGTSAQATLDGLSTWGLGGDPTAASPTGQAQNTKIDIDMQYTIDDTNGKINFLSNYGFDPTADSGAGKVTHPEYFYIEYANPDNPQEFNTVDITVASTPKASVSIPKTGDIKFFDKNDTQNYVLGDYVAPKYTTSTRVYDSLGNAYTVFVEFQKLSENQWAWKASEESGIPVSYVDDEEKTYTPSPNDLSSVVGGVVEFDSAGRVSSLKALRQNGKVEDSINIMRIKFDPGVKIDDGAAPPPIEGATELSAQIDFSELVQFSSEFSASITEQDGNAMGTLQNYAINTAGEVVGTFSNGKSESLGRIAVALFNNPAGLTEMGNTLYQVSANSGTAQIGLAGVGGRGTVTPGVLEMSNVDLAEEFTGMVIVQRAFQANARTVTTVDQILQELVNLKR